MNTSIKRRLEKLEGKIPNGYKETLDFLKLFWKIKNSGPPWPAPPPEVMMELETRARELANRGENLSIRRILKGIDGRGIPTINGG